MHPFAQCVLLIVIDFNKALPVHASKDIMTLAQLFVRHVVNTV
jgi:hypothetical protein